MVNRTYKTKIICNFFFSGKLTMEPTIKLRPVIVSDGEHPAMLMCSAYNFYPKQIQLIWLRNGQEVREGVSYSDPINNGDLSYQIYSHLEYTPVSGEVITCMVEHVSLSEPRRVSHGEFTTVIQMIHLSFTVQNQRYVFKKTLWFNIIFVSSHSCRWLSFCRTKNSDSCWSLWTLARFDYCQLWIFVLQYKKTSAINNTVEQGKDSKSNLNCLKF